MKQKLIRITTVPMSLNKLLEGQLNFMNQHYDVIAVSSDDKALKRIGQKEGVSTFNVEMTRKITPLKDLASLVKLYFFLKKQKPRIVHTHTPKAGIIGMLAAKLANVPIRLHTVAGLPLLEAKGFKRKILNYIEKLTYSCANRVYPNSYGLKSIIEQENFTASEKIKVIGNGSSNGIDTNYFNPRLINENDKESLRADLKVSNKDFVFIFVGRIVSDKGINELVESFNKLSLELNSIKLLLVGPTEADFDPIKEKTNKTINENIKIITTGYQQDVRPYFAISNVLVFPSYREGFPNVVMQAGAMGLPSIVSNINGCNEIIKDNINGSIVMVKSVNSLYDKMKNYAENTEEYKNIQNNTREIIVNKYQRSSFFKALLKEYKTFE
ncbi:glycosyltransferase family 4 protein [Lacinutrix sp.]|uniref:glycosyltransferase family 4 protein n=1 Tax=Lacinutrix sp. TaxID=1937692 RepID=UPI00260E1686|nr:glycosyltransferase family 4 protein [Lacinutrix sp.]MDG1715022.1 glycosyltransferase family 4 protein [Lacinutrix sp.]